MHIWVGNPYKPAERIPLVIKKRLEESRKRKASRAQRRLENANLVEIKSKEMSIQTITTETSSKRAVPLTNLPEDVSQALFRIDGWFQARDLLALRVCRALNSIIGYRPLHLFKRALPILKSWRALTRRSRAPQTPRTTRPRNNSFLRSPSRQRIERPVLIFA